MLSWLSKNTYPDFWKTYVRECSKKQPDEVKAIRFVVFDTETTGLDIKDDRVLSIGAVALKGTVIDIADSFEVYVEQERFDAATVEIHGILKEGTIRKVDEETALRGFLEYIGNAVLVAHHAAFDMAMINQALKRMGLPKLKNKMVDTGLLYRKTSFAKGEKTHYGLDELCKVFTIKQHDRHTASGDAYITALIFLKILTHLERKRKVTLNYLRAHPERTGLL